MSPAATGCEEARDLAPGFVLGALEPADMTAVREHLATCPELHEEFAELGGVVPYLAEDVEPVEPSAAVWERIREIAAADVRASAREDEAADRLIAAIGRHPVTVPRPETVPVGPDEVGPPLDSAPVATPDGPVQIATGRTAGQTAAQPAAETPAEGAAAQPRRLAGLSSIPTPAWIAAIAAVLIVVVLGVANILLQRDLAATRDYAAQLDRAITLAATPGSRSAVLVPSQSSAGGGVAVVPASGDGVLVVHDMAPTSGSEVYEAWVIPGNGAPAAAGSFQVGSDGRGWLETLSVPPAATPGTPLVVAITREPGPGATKPTPPIVVSGPARASA